MWKKKIENSDEKHNPASKLSIMKINGMEGTRKL